MKKKEFFTYIGIIAGSALLVGIGAGIFLDNLLSLNGRGSMLALVFGMLLSTANSLFFQNKYREFLKSLE